MSSVALIGPRQYTEAGPVTRGDLHLTEYHSIYNPDMIWAPGVQPPIEQRNVSFWQAPAGNPWEQKPAVQVAPLPVTQCCVEQPHDPVTLTPVPEPVQTACMAVAIGLMVLVRRIRG